MKDQDGQFSYIWYMQTNMLTMHLMMCWVTVPICSLASSKQGNKLMKYIIIIQIAGKKKPRSIQRRQTPPRLWPLTLWCNIGLSSRSRKLMSLDAAFCIVSWYRVYGFHTLRYHYLFILCDLWPSPVTSAFVKVTWTLVIRCIWLTCTSVIRCIWFCWMFVPKMKLVGSVEFKIWTFVWRNLKWHHYDVIPNLIFMKF